MKKVFIVSPFESQLEKRGVRNIEMAKFISTHYRVLFLTSNFSHQRKKNFEANDLVSTSLYFETIFFTTTGYQRNISFRRMMVHFFLAIKMLYYIIRNGKRGDIILVASIPVEIFSLVSLCKILGLKLVLDVRDIWPDALAISSSVKRIMFNTYCRCWYTLARAPDLVMHTAPSFEVKKNYFKSSDKWHFMPLGYDASRWGAIPKRSRDKVLRIVYVGSLELQCPLEHLISAVNQASDVELWVIGDGSHLSGYRKLSGPSIKYLGLTDPNVVPELLAKCDIGYLPFRGNSALPNKFFDYIAAGLPILTAGSHDAAEIVLDKGLGWNARLDVAEISNVLMDLQTDEINKCREATIEYATSNSSQVLYPKVIKLLDRMGG